ncbi:MAG: zinc ribbon domain-containing protein [Actinomycetota bacterium]|nr:zinc ribbon domain-containing protein [Actinomycetota bacterium]
MEPPADVPPAPPPTPDHSRRCPRCGAPHDAFQEYCLECGTRLVPLRSPTFAWGREQWTRESPLWFWATFLALLLIALVAAAIVIAATNDEEPRPRRGGQMGPGPTSSVFAIPTDVTTGALPTPPPPSETDATGTVPTFPGTTTGPGPTSSTTADGDESTSTTSPTTTAATGTLIAWPRHDGYTVVLDSIPVSAGRSRAVARADAAIARGLDRVGVLTSSDFASLRAGYYVVFAGIYDTEARARAAVSGARSAGYARAYPREIDRG